MKNSQLLLQSSKLSLKERISHAHHVEITLHTNCKNVIKADGDLKSQRISNKNYK